VATAMHCNLRLLNAAPVILRFYADAHTKLSLSVSFV